MAATTHGASPADDINLIRLRAGINPVGVVDQNLIRDERYRELCWEGFRLHDLKRWGDNIGALPYDAGNLILPIPEREMEANPLNMLQNTYYTGG